MVRRMSDTPIIRPLSQLRPRRRPRPLPPARSASHFDLPDAHRPGVRSHARASPGATLTRRTMRARTSGHICMSPRVHASLRCRRALEAGFYIPDNTFPLRTSPRAVFSWSGRHPFSMSAARPSYAYAHSACTPTLIPRYLRVARLVSPSPHP